MSLLDIAGLDKAELLAALVNGTTPLGVGALVAVAHPPLMTRDDAQKLLDEYPAARFDYVRGRPLKVDLSGDALDARLYDRDAGEGAAAAVVLALRQRQTGPAKPWSPPDPPLDPDNPLRGTGRSHRMLEKAKRIAATQDVAVVCHSLNMADTLRSQFSRMEPMNSAHRVRFTSTDAHRHDHGRNRSEYVLWDHHARDSRIADLEREIARLRDVDVGT